MDESDEVEEIPQTWKKFSNSARKTGFREGADHGKDNVFQESFDAGFLEGIRNGFLLGRYKGALRAHAVQSSNDDEEESRLKDSRRAACQICSNRTLLESKIDDIKPIQTKSCNELLNYIHSQHSGKVNIQLQHKLD